MRIRLLFRCALLGGMVLGSSLAGSAQRGHALPVVSFAEVPLYPPIARAANISGVVHVVITTDGHRVVTAHVQDGPTVLSDAAQKNASGWQFATHEPTTFTVTYVYKLVDNRKPLLHGPKVILQLPTEIEVDAVRWLGTKDMAPTTVPSGASHPTGASLSHEAGHAHETPTP
jgi:hypothetical protein